MRKVHNIANSVVILDEAQNTTVEQMKLFVTRIGEFSQFAINGDESQSDLRHGVENGLQYITRKLTGVSPNINVIRFTTSDCVRSSIVQEILVHLDTPDAPPARRQNGHQSGPSLLSS